MVFGGSFYVRARICKRLGAQETIPRNRFRQARNRFLGSLKVLQIRAQVTRCRGGGGELEGNHAQDVLIRKTKKNVGLMTTSGIHRRRP